MANRVSFGDTGAALGLVAIAGGIIYNLVSRLEEKKKKEEQAKLSNNNREPQFTLTFHNDIYAYQDRNGDIINNTDGEGILVAKNYKGSDGNIYQVNGNNEWFIWDGNSWEFYFRA